MWIYDAICCMFLVIYGFNTDFCNSHIVVVMYTLSTHMRTMIRTSGFRFHCAGTVL